MSTDVESDRISWLPDDIIDQILFHLPITDVMRSSVLSRKWGKKNLSTQTNIVFDRQCVIRAATSEEDPSVTKSKYIRIISSVLVCHHGTINRVKICNSGCDLVWMNYVADIENLMLSVTLRHIKELVLEVRLEQRYKMPRRFFSCQSLQHIRLYCCWLKPLPEFQGFRNLKTLDLEQVTMTQDVFEILIFGSPLLEKLTLADFDGFTQINIRGPNIKSVQIIGKFEGISFENTPQLAKVLVDLSLYLNSQTSQSRLHGCSSNLVNFFNRLPNIQSLLMHSYFIKFLLADVVPVKLPTPCINLTSLSICINFNDLKEISVVLCLLNSSPNLQVLRIIARLEEQADLSTCVSDCWEDIFSEPVMPLKLQLVKIQDISGTKSELDFIRFLLLYSPVLEKMTVKPVINGTSKLMTEVIRFRRVSGQAEVIYHVKDFIICLFSPYYDAFYGG